MNDRAIKMWLETDEEKAIREKEETKDNLTCLAVGCFNERLSFSKYCAKCYDEKYPRITEIEVKT